MNLFHVLALLVASSVPSTTVASSLRGGNAKLRELTNDDTRRMLPAGGNGRGNSGKTNGGGKKVSEPAPAPAPGDTTVTSTTVAASTTSCPATWPNPGDSCSAGTPSRCEYGSETCCDTTYVSFVCECYDGTFQCYNTDACMVPQCETTTKPPPSEPFDRELAKGGNGGGRGGGGGNTAVDSTTTVAAEPVEDDPTQGSTTACSVTCESGYVCDSTVGYCKADEGTSCELCSFVAPCDASLSCVPTNPKRTSCGDQATCQRIATTTVATETVGADPTDSATTVSTESPSDVTNCVNGLTCEVGDTCTFQECNTDWTCVCSETAVKNTLSCPTPVCLPDELTRI